MSNLFEQRLRLTPAEYAWAQQEYERAITTHWTHLEVQMQSDVLDWASPKLNQHDRSAIAGILRGFTVLENIVGDHWRTIAGIFRTKPELFSLAVTYSAQEAVHAYSYNHLEASLGIGDSNWPAFEADEIAQAKLGHYMQQLVKIDKSLAEFKDDELAELAMALAIFAGIAEGVSLFSSFAILLSFGKPGYGMFKGMAQILSWSIRDEEAHSRTGIALFKELIAICPQLRPSQARIVEAFELAIANELAFISNAFANSAQLSTISYAEAEAFVYHRTNRKLAELGYEPIAKYQAYEKRAKSVTNWFYPMTNGTPLHDFFVQRANGAAYASTIKQDFSNANIADAWD